MMYKLFPLYFICFLCLTGVSSFAYDVPEAELSKIKSAMIRSIESPQVTDSLYQALKSKNSSVPLIIAYIGTLEALKAKHAWNPYQKIKYVTLSQKTMKSAVNKDPDDLEIRFMRFSIQHYTPSFLGFSKDLEQDRKMIARQFKTKNFGTANSKLVKSIAVFMIKSERCTKEELLLFKKYA